MSKIDVARTWSLNYRLLTSVIASVVESVQELGLEIKDLFLLAELDAHPHPAALAEALLMPKPTVTVILKRLEAGGFIRREIDPKDLRRHKLTLTPTGRRAMTRGMTSLSEAFGQRLGRLSGPQQTQFLGLLERLVS